MELSLSGCNISESEGAGDWGSGWKQHHLHPSRAKNCITERTAGLLGPGQSFGSYTVGNKKI